MQTSATGRLINNAEGGRQTAEGTTGAQRRHAVCRPRTFGRRERHAGFTLIELLVVLVIIGIIITMATLAVGNGRDATLKTEAQRVATLVDLAGDEATLQGRELGLQFTQTGYRFLFLQPAQSADKPAQWLPITDDRELRRRQFPSGVVPQLLLENVPQALPVKTPKTGTPPQVVLFASGERTPFALGLSSGDNAGGYQISAGPLGTPTVQRTGAAS